MRPLYWYDNRNGKKDLSKEREMATRSSILAWESLWKEEPDRLKSMGSQKSVGQDLVTQQQ